MEIQRYEELKRKFAAADTDTKIDMYVQAEDLTHSQYKELLRMFPFNDLQRLEKALG